MIHNCFKLKKKDVEIIFENNGAYVKAVTVIHYMCV